MTLLAQRHAGGFKAALKRRGCNWRADVPRTVPRTLRRYHHMVAALDSFRHDASSAFTTTVVYVLLQAARATFAWSRDGQRDTRAERDTACGNVTSR